MKTPLQNQLQALPTYLGAKRKLLAWIQNGLSQVCPAHHWKDLTFIDLFMGGGSVSLWAKAQGFQQVIANDISSRSQILATAFLSNQRVTLTPSDLLGLTQALPESAGWIEAAYSPSVFSSRHAQALDKGFYWASQHPDPSKRALLLTVMWHLTSDFVAFPTSLGSSNRPFAEALDGLRSWDDLNPKRYVDKSLKRLCEPTWARLGQKARLVNAGVMGGSPVQVYQADALAILPTLQGDILYLDPPYAGTVSYERGNQVLDTLLAGKTELEPACVSPFSKGIDALNALLSQAEHIPIWLLSYGNQELSLAELEALVRVHAGTRTVVGYAKRYKHLSHVSRTETNEELLVIAYP